MKKIVLVFSLFSILPFNLFSQQNFWVPTNGPYGGTIRSLAINFNGDIFCGTYFSGIFRSTDNGENWVNQNNGITNLNINVIKINSTNMIFVGTENGIFRSTNNGESWIQINNGLSNFNIQAISIGSNNHLFVGAGSKVFRSTNDGDSWIDASNGLTTSTRIISLAANSDGDIFASSDYNWTTFKGGVFRSTDNGESWNKLNDNYFLTLAINSNDLIFAGTQNGILRSTDNGVNWVAINNGLTAYNILAITFNANQDIFIGTQYGTGGVFRSTDNGADRKSVV